MADETDASMEAPATGLAPERGGVLMEFSARAFLALRFSLAALDR